VSHSHPCSSPEVCVSPRSSHPSTLRKVPPHQFRSNLSFESPFGWTLMCVSALLFLPGVGAGPLIFAGVFTMPPPARRCPKSRSSRSPERSFFSSQPCPSRLLYTVPGFESSSLGLSSYRPVRCRSTGYSVPPPALTLTSSLITLLVTLLGTDGSEGFVTLSLFIFYPGADPIRSQTKQPDLFHAASLFCVRRRRPTDYSFCKTPSL